MCTGQDCPSRRKAKLAARLLYRLPMQERPGDLKALLFTDQHQGVPGLQAQLGRRAVDDPFVANNPHHSCAGYGAEVEFSESPADVR